VEIGCEAFFQPVQQSNDSSPSVPYQSVDPTGCRYVNWSEKLDNLGDAKKVAALWAELVQNYQRDQGQKARDVKLIERYRSTREGRKATPDRTGDGTRACERLTHRWRRQSPGEGIRRVTAARG
jgi:hypothetical protein